MIQLGVLVTVSALSALVVVFVFGLCSKKKPEINNQDGGPPKGVTNLSTPSQTLQTGGPPRDQVPSYKVFMEQAAETGLMNNREAPETFKNDGPTFNKNSVNFSNFGDFRKDAVKNSVKIQNAAAANKVSGIISPLVDSSSDEYSYDSEEEEEESNPPAYTKSQDSAGTGGGMDILNPTVGKTGAMEDDFTAGINKFNPAQQQRGANRAQVPANLIQSLSFTKEEVDSRMKEIHGPGTTESMRTKRKTKKKVRKKVRKEGEDGGNEIPRKKVRKRKKKPAAEGGIAPEEI